MRCELETTTAGPVGLRLGTSAINLWHGTQPVAVMEPMQVNLSAGKNVLTFAYDLTEAKDPIRVEFVEVPSSTARFQIVGGK
jgi:hypothetical protein